MVVPFVADIFRLAAEASVISLASGTDMKCLLGWIQVGVSFILKKGRKYNLYKIEPIIVGLLLFFCDTLQKFGHSIQICKLLMNMWNAKITQFVSAPHYMYSIACVVCEIASNSRSSTGDFQQNSMHVLLIF